MRENICGSKCSELELYLQIVFWNTCPRNISATAIARLRTHSYEFAAPEHPRASKCSFIGGARENTQCALRARRVVFPLAPVDLVHQQRRVADGSCPRPRRQRKDFQGSRMIGITITTRPPRLVVRLEVCASG